VRCRFESRFNVQSKFEHKKSLALSCALKHSTRVPERSKRTSDLNQVAFEVVKKTEESSLDDAKSLLSDASVRRWIMREMGSRGGKKGGVARAKSLTPKRRSEIASDAARKRWQSDKK